MEPKELARVFLVIALVGFLAGLLVIDGLLRSGQTALAFLLAPVILIGVLLALLAARRFARAGRPRR